MSKEPEFNFDIDELDKAIKSGSVTVPKGLDREQLREWLISVGHQVKVEGINYDNVV